jgi:hypothetical protein
MTSRWLGSPWGTMNRQMMIGHRYYTNTRHESWKRVTMPPNSNAVEWGWSLNVWTRMLNVPCHVHVKRVGAIRIPLSYVIKYYFYESVNVHARPKNPAVGRLQMIGPWSNTTRCMWRLDHRIQGFSHWWVLKMVESNFLFLERHVQWQ